MKPVHLLVRLESLLEAVKETPQFSDYAETTVLEAMAMTKNLIPPILDPPQEPQEQSATVARIREIADQGFDEENVSVNCGEMQGWATELDTDQQTIRNLAGTIEALEGDKRKLEAFKTWTHQYLDSHGVPRHPPGVHGAEGCRIGDRMDWLMTRIAELEQQLNGWKSTVEEERQICAAKLGELEKYKQSFLMSLKEELESHPAPAVIDREAMAQFAHAAYEQRMPREKADPKALVEAYCVDCPDASWHGFESVTEAEDFARSLPIDIGRRIFRVTEWHYHPAKPEGK